MSSENSGKASDFDVLKAIADEALYACYGQRLSDLEAAILQGSCEGYGYREIAKNRQYEETYLSRDVGPKLWKKLSVAIGDRVSKTNYREPLKRYAATHLIPAGEIGIAAGVRLAPPPLPVSNSYGAPPNGRLPSPLPDAILPNRVPLYGREADLEQAKGFILQQPCGLLAIAGGAGVGKTAFLRELVEEVRAEFTGVIWRSLQSAPTLPELLTDLLTALSGGPPFRESTALADLSGQVIAALQRQRWLLVLDDGEALLQARTGVGQYRSGYEIYQPFWERLKVGTHQSWVVLSGQELPTGVGDRPPPETVHLEGLSEVAAQQLLEQHSGVVATSPGGRALVVYYGGNPLALQQVASIAELFGGQFSRIWEQLQQGQTIAPEFDRRVQHQLDRLSAPEWEVLYWLATLLEPMPFATVQQALVSEESRQAVVMTLRSLRQRSLVRRVGELWTLDPVLRFAVLHHFLSRVEQDLRQERCSILHSHALIRAQAKDYLREQQTEHILKRVAAQLNSLCGSSRQSLEEKLQRIFQWIQTHLLNQPGYAASNFIHLCDYLQINLEGWDFSNLAVWQTCLQDKPLYNVKFVRSDLRGSVFACQWGQNPVIAFGQNDQLLATSDDTGEIRLWQVDPLTQYATTQSHSCAVKVLAFSPDGRLLASGSDDGTVMVWALSPGRMVQQSSQRLGRSISSLCFSPDSSLLAIGSSEPSTYLGGTNLYLWELERRVRPLPHVTGVVWLAFSPDQQCLVSLSDDRQVVRLWEVSTLREVCSCKRDAFVAQACSPNGHLLLASLEDWSLQLWEASLQPEAELHLQALPPPPMLYDQEPTLAFVPGCFPGAVLSICDGEAISFWDTASTSFLQTLPAPHRLRQLVFGTAGHYLGSLDSGCTLRLWDWRSGRSLHTLNGADSQMCAIALSPQDGALAVGCSDGVVRVWRSGHTQQWILRGHQDWVQAVAFSPELPELGPRWLASGSGDGVVRLWQGQTGALDRDWRTPHTHIRVLAFSPDSRLLAVSGDRDISLWDPETGAAGSVLMGHSDPVHALAFHPQGHLLASGSADSTLCLWDTMTGTCCYQHTAHQDRVYTLSFSPDGTLLASGGSDRTVRLWDTATASLVEAFDCSPGQIRLVFFDAGGNAFAISEEDHSLSLWNVRTRTPVSLPRTLHLFLQQGQYAVGDRLLVRIGSGGAIERWDWQRSQPLSNLWMGPYNGMDITQATGLAATQRWNLIRLGAVEAPMPGDVPDW